MDFSPAALRVHFAKLSEDRAMIDAELTPLREKLDQLVRGEIAAPVAEAHAIEAEVREKIKALQARLYPIEMERAAVARALGGKTSEPANG